MITITKQWLLIGVLTALFTAPCLAASKPNILFIAIDDFNDWGPNAMDGEPFDVWTPNFDRLTQRGVLFTNAHCAAPSCNPSRTSLMTGIHPTTSGVYANAHDWRQNERLNGVEVLPEYFQKHGYKVLGCGKIYHANQDSAEQRRGYMSPRGWDAFYPSLRVQLPDPSVPVKIPKRGEDRFDWGGTGRPIEEMGDHKVVNWAIERLNQSHDKPLFLAVGIYRPHMPWYVPDKFYDDYEGHDIKPPTNPVGWQDNMPASIANMGKRYRQYTGKVGPTRGYAAAMTYGDYELGRLIDAFEKSDYAANTVIVVWTDHGWHLGEKGHFSKFTLWEESTRVPLLVIPAGGTGPKGARKMPQAVSLLDVYPTLVSMAGLPANAANEGRDLSALVRGEVSQAAANRAVVTSSNPTSHAVRDARYRYVRKGAAEALFDHHNDPREFYDVSGDPAHTEALARLRAAYPSDAAPKMTSIKS
ncbi:MAG: sulfatase, partial [Planctomycetota bacterium]